jgi:hypothetical protein
MTISKIDYRYEAQEWSIYLLTMMIGFFVHEVGHCIPAWLNGYGAVPTPAKKYLLESIPPKLTEIVALGGIVGSVLFSLVVLAFYLFKKPWIRSSILAGAMVSPGMYSLRFFLQGRGHDATEFQDAQSALGFSYDGHAVDFLFIIILTAGVVAWLMRSKQEFKIFRRLLIGFIVTLSFVIYLQYFNNLIFDPVFNSGK